MPEAPPREDPERLGDPEGWLALQGAAALRPDEAVALLREGLGPREVLARLPGARRASARRLAAATRSLERAGARLVPWGSVHYPPRLLHVDDAAPVLAVRGDPAVLGATAVAIVGSRAASAYGLHVARQVAGELARSGVVVVSGLAYGIDAAAHEAALDAGGRTIAFQACGPDRVYPLVHRALADRIAQGGAVVSEFAPGTPPLKAYFPLRNRLISGMSRALVVVEARERSGSLTTARHAADQGVDVFAVPGPITAPGHAGSNRLLRDGVWLLLQPRDVLESLRWPAATPPTAASALTERARELLRALRRAPASGDELSRRLGRAPAELAPALLELELAGAAGRDRDGRWCALS